MSRELIQRIDDVMERAWQHQMPVGHVVWRTGAPGRGHEACYSRWKRLLAKRREVSKAYLRDLVMDALPAPRPPVMEAGPVVSGDQQGLGL